MEKQRYFYNDECDDIVTDSDLLKIWNADETLRQEYDCFDDYVNACQWYENGALEEVTGKTLDDYIARHYASTYKRYRVYYLDDDAEFRWMDAGKALVCNVIEDMTDSYDDDEYDAIYVYVPQE